MKQKTKSQLLEMMQAVDGLATVDPEKLYDYINAKLTSADDPTKPDAQCPSVSS